jgi:Putative phage metallopeptidase
VSILNLVTSLSQVCYCLSECSAAQICAIVEHELYHCAQALDAFGDPKFTEDGEPVWAIRPHDIEEFSGVVRRYGAVLPDQKRFIEALKQGPTIAAAHINGVCGTCLKVA